MKSTIITAIMAAGVLALGWQVSSGDEDDRWDISKMRGRTPGVAPVTNLQYVEECGSCHMAYPPGLLPARSWQALMGDLDDHFGDNAELEAEVLAALTGYLVKNSADNSPFRRSRKITHSLAEAHAPLRITQLPYIRREHREIPNRLITGNPDVSSLSNCAACHRQADAGSFSEREILVPGYGHWDD